MANYTQAHQSRFSKEEEKRFRELFNKWGASVEGYNRKTLGDELNIVPSLADRILFFKRVFNIFRNKLRNSS